MTTSSWRYKRTSHSHSSNNCVIRHLATQWLSTNISSSFHSCATIANSDTMSSWKIVLGRKHHKIDHLLEHRRWIFINAAPRRVLNITHFCFSLSSCDEWWCQKQHWYPSLPIVVKMREKNLKMFGDRTTKLVKIFSTSFPNWINYNLNRFWCLLRQSLRCHSPCASVRRKLIYSYAICWIDDMAD